MIDEIEAILLPIAAKRGCQRFMLLFWCRQLMVMDETYVMNQCKEDVCFVSTDFNKDMATAR